MTDTIRVLIVDDHVIVRNGLEQLLATVADMHLVGFASDGQAAIEAVEQLSPDVVLMDLSMPVMDGVEATAIIKSRSPQTKIVVLTSFSEQQRVLAALEAGADGYVLKHADPEQILQAISAAHAGGAPIDPKVARILIEAKRVGTTNRGALTEREVEVLHLVRSGMPNKLIARRLGISERTVKAHLTKIFQSLGVTDRTQAALWAAQHLPDGVA